VVSVQEGWFLNPWTRERSLLFHLDRTPMIFRLAKCGKKTSNFYRKPSKCFLLFTTRSCPVIVWPVSFTPFLLYTPKLLALGVLAPDTLVAVSARDCLINDVWYSCAEQQFDSLQLQFFGNVTSRSLVCSYRNTEEPQFPYFKHQAVREKDQQWCVSICNNSVANLLGRLDPEDEGITIGLNVGNYLPVDMP
jgi:hypothetical protein